MNTYNFPEQIVEELEQSKLEFEIDLELGNATVSVVAPTAIDNPSKSDKVRYSLGLVVINGDSNTTEYKSIVQTLVDEGASMPLLVGGLSGLSGLLVSKRINALYDKMRKELYIEVAKETERKARINKQQYIEDFDINQ